MAERKRKNRPHNSVLNHEEWSAIFKLYADGHSVNTCATIYNVDHGRISERLKEVGIFRESKKGPRPDSKLRKTVLPKGKFADLYK